MPSIGFFAKPTPDEQRYAWDALRCYGYGASRRLSATNLAPDEPNAATASLFSDDAPLVNAEEWLLRLDYSASKESAVQDQQKKRLATVQRLLLDILPEDEVRDIRFTAPTTTHRDPRVEFQTPYGWVGLRQLGHGYRTLIAWMVDFASRLFDRAPDSPDPLATPAVALIDEIDLHLHPLWQRQLIGHLTKCFPNTQFVVTAHSPLIVQAAGEDANIVLLRREGDHVVIDNDHNAIHGWRVDQVLTSDLFGLPSARPPQLDDLFERREQILTKASLTEKDRKELAALEERIGQLPAGETTEQAEILARIDRNLQFLREQRTGK